MGGYYIYHILLDLFDFFSFVEWSVKANLIWTDLYYSGKGTASGELAAYFYWHSYWIYNYVLLYHVICINMPKTIELGF